MKTFLIMVLASVLSLSASAQTADLTVEPGYIDFAAMDAVYGEPNVMINIGGSLLRLMAIASKEDPEAAALMESLAGVRISVYPTAGNTEPGLEQIARVKKVLQAESWEPVVQVRETNEEVQIFMKTDEGGMQGLAVMAVDEEEAVFINIIGELDPAQLGKVMEQLNVDVGLE
jgi:hypothetical protein